MMKGMSPEKRTQMMLEAPVSRVIPRLAIPTIISMLITAIYNMADTFFVSQLGTSASGAVGVIFSAMAIIQAVSFMMGMGTGTNVSQALGAGDEERARRYAAVGFFTAFGMGVVIAILGLSNIDPLVRFLGATETIAPYAKDYATYIFYAAPFMMCSFVMNNLLRFEGLAIYGMVGITTGGILNMVLDPIFIFGFGLGTSGAAIATAISQFVSFTVLLIMCSTKPDAITISPRNFKPTMKMYGRILYIGFRLWAVRVSPAYRPSCSIPLPVCMAMRPSRRCPSSRVSSCSSIPRSSASVRASSRFAVSAMAQASIPAYAKLTGSA